MKLSEIKGERAIEVLADLIDPISILAMDLEFRKLISENRVEAIKHLLKNHPKTIIHVLAIVNGEDPETYEPNVFALPKVLLDFFNDPTVMELFGLQSQATTKTSSGSVTENIEANEP